MSVCGREMVGSVLLLRRLLKCILAELFRLIVDYSCVNYAVNTFFLRMESSGYGILNTVHMRKIRTAQSANLEQMFGLHTTQRNIIFQFGL